MSIAKLPKAFAAIATVLFLITAANAQNVTSSIVGRVVDPASAVLAAAPVTLTDQNTGNSRAATTDSSGVFRFADVAPGTYSVSIAANGFKGLTERDIVVSASETRDVGTLHLELGNVTESISVTADVTPVQLASSEKSQLIDSNQLNNVTLKGRDLFGYMKLIPGVIDTTASRDVTSPGAIGGITINGNTSAKNFTVDGVTDMDTGSNGTLHYEPNLDSVQELKILSSNYQAEFGRNSGGTITVVTKSGTKDFHGTAQWSHRHEQFNANNWLNNHTLTNGLPQPTPRYRYNVETYTIGGPAFIPHLFNRDRKKLFFFFSQEYTGQFVSGGTQTKYTPTALERQGNFSQSLANNGSLIVITDPQNGNAPFSGNIIPASRIDPTGFGPATLNFFPLPNAVGTGALANIMNYTESASATHPRRNDVLRLDPYLTSKIQGYFRWINDHDDMIALYQGVQFTSAVGGLLGQKGIAPIDHPNPGHGYSGSVVYEISPTLVNEATVGESWNTWSWYSTDNYASESRGLIPGIPQLFPIPTTNPSGVSVTNGYQNILPQFQYGASSPEPNAMTYTRNNTSAGNYENFNTIWTVTDNLTKIWGNHSIKTGVYIERNTKIQPAGPVYPGSFNFQPDANNPLNTGNGYANAFLGYVDTYQQATARAVFNVEYWNVEFYVQDNWRVNRRLTLDYGVRFYHQPSQNDLNHTFSNFNTQNFKPADSPRLYVPGVSSGKRVAIDPGTGAVAPVAYIGLYVPNSGNPANGLGILGQNGIPWNTYNIAYLRAAPRFGFAYDVFGDGKTALRGGWGLFFNRLDGNQVYNLSGQAPYSYVPQVSFTTDSQIAAAGGNLIFGPATLYSWPNGNVPWNYVQNVSLDVQRSIGGFVADIGYTGNFSTHQNLNYDINYLPLGARFRTSSLDPTNGNKPLPDILLRTQYSGFNTIYQYAEIGTAYYHALTASLQRRLTHGLAVGAAYTYSHALGLSSVPAGSVTGASAFTPVVPDNHSWNYGRLATDRPHNLQVSYSYEIPGITKYVGRFVGAVTDHWTYSGVMSSTSGAPFSPTFGFSSGTVPDYTGTPDVSARPNVVGNPYANVPQGLFFNPAAFALPALGTSSPTTPVLGNMGGGAGVLRYPHVTNFDMTMSKFAPVGLGERRGFRIMVQAYNVFNHTEYNAMNTQILFNPTTGAVTNGTTVGTPTGTLPNRILAFTLRFEY
ncbi:MAG TPA: carboxypeptidase-like regulatory domain-containing protein [Bryobacteraceae bacterium]|nr:carboxypeptidase-like regulatory domain-containing protein [Bryobacteraceae bacterium]